jgi:hypothetical protein
MVMEGAMRTAAIVALVIGLVCLAVATPPGCDREEPLKVGGMLMYGCQP